MSVTLSMIARQRKRVLATVLGHAERTFYDRLSEAEQKQFREVVLNSVGVFADLAMDLVRSSDEGWVVNDDARKVLEQVNVRTRRLELLLQEEYDD